MYIITYIGAFLKFIIFPIANLSIMNICFPTFRRRGDSVDQSCIMQIEFVFQIQQYLGIVHGFMNYLDPYGSTGDNFIICVLDLNKPLIKMALFINQNLHSVSHSG